MALKYSRQRQVIFDFLMTRKDHPSAEVVYQNVRQEYPNISLGTVYRNLSLLADMGEIQRLRVGDGIDHFDADTSEHYHFVCSECGCVTDLNPNKSGPPALLADKSVIPQRFQLTFLGGGQSAHWLC